MDALPAGLVRFILAPGDSWFGAVGSQHITPAMKRPLVPVALLYGAGLLLGNLGEAPLAGLFLAGFGFGVGALGWPRARLWLLAGLAVVCGWANLQSRTTAVSPQEARRLAGESPCLVTARGVLSGRPSARVLVREEQERWHTLALRELTALRLGHGDWRPARGAVQTTTPGVLPGALRDGQSVEVEGVLSAPAAPLAEGLFDYRLYLEQQGIYHQMKVSSTNFWRLYGAARPPTWTERFSLWAMPALERGLPERDEPLRLQWAMILGWKTALTDEVSEPFMRSGTMHIFVFRTTTPVPMLRFAPTSCVSKTFALVLSSIACPQRRANRCALPLRPQATA